jgi:hypothetical protein
MKKVSLVVVLLGVFCLPVLFVTTTFATDKGPVDTVLQGCKSEFETFCKGVTPGQGHLLACLYAYEDQLSGRCEYALYDASAQLERAIAAMTFVANECREDLTTYCSTIQPGEGRLLNCLDKNKAKVSKRCTQALKDVGAKK